MSDVFRPWTSFVVKEISENKCEIEAIVYVNFIKRSLVKSKIQKNTVSDFKDWV